MRRKVKEKRKINLRMKVYSPFNFRPLLICLAVTMAAVLTNSEQVPEYLVRDDKKSIGE
jgi:hypothetical protein